MQRELRPSFNAASAWTSWPATIPLVCAVLRFIAWPWVRSDLLWRDVADAPNHLVRIYVVHAALARGEWYPRWLADLYLGYGYPLLNFYAPSTYYVGAALHELGLTIYGSFQWTGVLGAMLGATGAYALAAALHDGRQDAALLAGAAYALAPYPFLTNLYVRGAVPEALGLGLLPWLLLAALHAWRGGGAWTPALAGLVAVLLLTHNITSLLGMGLLLVWLLALVRLGGAPVGPALRRVGGAVAAGLGLSAFFWLPALAESRYVQLDLAQGGLYDFRRWLFDPLAVAPAVARPDYPHTRTGPADLALVFSYRALGMAAPEKISLGQLLLWLCAALAALSAPRRAALPLFWAALAAGCWFLNTTWSSPLWEHLPLLPLVQFPWRLYGPLALCLALAAAGALAVVAPARAADLTTWARSATWGARGVAAALAGLLIWGAVAVRPYAFRAAPPPDVNAGDLAALETNRYGAGTTSGGEFLPLTARWEAAGDSTRRGIRVYEEAYPQAGWIAGWVRLLDSPGVVRGVYRSGNWIAAEVEAEAPARLAIHQLLFPGWRVYVDGRPARAAPGTYEPRADAPDEEGPRYSLGFMVVDVPAGRHRVEAVFGPTPPRLAGGAVSAATLALAVWLAVSRTKREEVRGRKQEAWVMRALPGLAVAALGAGCAVAGAELGARPVRTPSGGSARLVLDVAGLVAASRAETRTPVGAGRGSFPPFLDVRYARLAGEARRWLYMHPPSDASVRLRVPPQAYLQAGLGLEPETWTTDYGDGVRFIVEADGPSGRKTLFDRHVNPRAHDWERGWVDVWVSLEEVANQEVRLTLRTDPAQDLSYDWAGWANPAVVIWDSARPHPGAPHQW